MSKTMFITGTNSGFGRATVELFADRGWNVVATVRKIEYIDMFQDRPNVRVLLLDMNDAAAISSVVAQAIREFGQIDVLVNNAGYFQMGPLESSTMEQIRAQFETNVFGLIALTKAFLPHFRANGTGTIINVSSLSAENGYPFAAAYSASKAAVAVLSEALNIELHGLGISVKTILPGQHATQIFTKIDAAETMPAAYQPLWSKFTEQQRAVKGSRAEGVAQAIYRAASDHQADRVKYFVGPDATLIPKLKRLLGQSRYFRFFKRSLLRQPNRWLMRLMPQGDTEVEVRLNARW
jgi:NAD(P)-dependent dehydrogenase (short-subunit alcohol dehydrogenase family)